MEQTAVRSVSCDTCGKQYRYKPQLAGKKVKCPCGGRVRFPLEEQQPAASAAPVEVDIQHLAQAEAAASQDEETDEAPPEAPPLPATKPARASVGAAMAKQAIARATKTSASTSEDKWKWWYFIAGGIFMFGVAVWKYITLSQAEATGDSAHLRISGNEHTLYMLFGKWGVVGGSVLAGLLAIAVGVYQFKQQRKST